MGRYTQETEYIDCSMAANYVGWIRHFLLDLNLNSMNKSIEIYYDNTLTIDLIYSDTNSSNRQQREI